MLYDWQTGETDDPDGLPFAVDGAKVYLDGKDVTTLPLDDGCRGHPQRCLTGRNGYVTFVIFDGNGAMVMHLEDESAAYVKLITRYGRVCIERKA